MVVQSETKVEEQRDTGSPELTSDAHLLEFKNLAKGVEEGNYKLVGWAADTLGRRLIDEIFQIAAYTPDAQFSQYIMPFSNIRSNYRRRHNICIMTLGKVRMLRDIRTHKVLPTKSVISALTDFVEWLEKNRGDAKDGIILIYHEIHKSIPAILLESLRRYNLSERFLAVVKGFANSFDLTRAKCAKTTKSFTLRVMSKVLLNKDLDLTSSQTRAQMSYEVVTHLGQSEVPDLDSQKGSGDAKGYDELLIKMILPFTNPVSEEEEEIKNFKVLLERQNTFKPVFGALLNATPVERQHASHLRRLLAENNLNYEILKETFEKKSKDGLQEILIKEIHNAKEEELTELLEILDCFFDPEKKPVEPKPRFFQNNNRRYRTNSRSYKDREHSVNNNITVDVKTEASIESTTTLEPKVEPKEAPLEVPSVA